MTSEPSDAFASMIAARSVQMPLFDAVSHLPSPAFPSGTSAVLLTLSVNPLGAATAMGSPARKYPQHNTMSSSAPSTRVEKIVENIDESSSWLLTPSSAAHQRQE